MFRLKNWRVAAVACLCAASNPWSATAAFRVGDADPTKALTGDVRALGVAYIEAVGDKNFERVAELLHPDLEFQMPGKTIHGAQEYVRALQRLGPVLVRNEVKKTILDGTDVVVVYDFVTDTPAGAIPSMEWLTIEGGRIRTVRLLFHSQPWHLVLEELARRTKSAAQAPKDAGRIALSGRFHIFARPSAKERLIRFFTNVLGSQDPVNVNRPGSQAPILAFPFSNGTALSVEFSEDALEESQARRGAWLELQADDPTELERRILGSGVARMEYLDNRHFYFVAPGGQVMRVVATGKH